MLSRVSEVLTNGASGVRSQELERSGVGGGGSDDDGVLHAVSLLEQTGDVGDGGSLLTDGDVDAVEGLGVVTSLEDGLLVDDGVDSDGSLTSLSITNDKLTLASANRHLIKLKNRRVSGKNFIINISRQKLALARVSAASFVALTRESTDLRPVCMGSCTDFLGMIPGAFNSILVRWSVTIGPLPSMALPSGSTTLPRRASPMGTSTMEPVLFTISPSWISLFAWTNPTG